MRRSEGATRAAMLMYSCLGSMLAPAPALAFMPGSPAVRAGMGRAAGALRVCSVNLNAGRMLLAPSRSSPTMVRRGGVIGLTSMIRPEDPSSRHARAVSVLSSSSSDKVPAEIPRVELDASDGALEAYDDGQSPDQLFFAGTCFEFVLAAVAAVIGWVVNVSVLGAGFDLSPATVGAGLLWTAVPLAFVSCIRLFDFEFLKEIHLITIDFARKLFVDRSMLQLAVFCFAAGFGEELLFRGIFHQKLELLFGFYPAATAVAVGFGAAHFLTPAYFVISGLSSYIFSFMFASSGNNIVIPVVAHAVYDFIALKLVLNEIADMDEKALKEGE